VLELRYLAKARPWHIAAPPMLACLQRTWCVRDACMHLAIRIVVMGATPAQARE
jgi:hypothetical protein